jgi:hypothetical protein
MPLSWNEIRHRAIQFAHNWAGTWSEAAEKQTFWNEFFDVFGIQRRLVASFEEPVKHLFRVLRTTEDKRQNNLDETLLVVTLSVVA